MGFGLKDFHALMTQNYFDVLNDNYEDEDDDLSEGVPTKDWLKASLDKQYTIRYARSHTIHVSYETFKTFCESNLCKGVLQLMSHDVRIPLSTIGNWMISVTETDDRLKSYYDEFKLYLESHKYYENTSVVLLFYANQFIQHSAIYMSKD